MSQTLDMEVEAVCGVEDRVCGESGVDGRETNRSRMAMVARVFEGFREQTLAESLVRMGVVGYTFVWRDGRAYEQNPWRVLWKGLVRGSVIGRTKIRGMLYGVLRGLRAMAGWRRYATLYRGVDTRVDWRAGDMKEFPALVSATPDLRVARRAIAARDAKALLRLHWARGVDIGHYMYMDDADAGADDSTVREVVMEPMSKGMVVEVGEEEGQGGQGGLMVVDVVMVDWGREYLLGEMIPRVGTDEDEDEGSAAAAAAAERGKMEAERRAAAAEEEVGRLRKENEELRKETKDMDWMRRGMERIERIEKMMEKMMMEEDRGQVETMEKMKKKDEEMARLEEKATEPLPGHDVVMQGNGASGETAMGLYRQAGEMGCAMGYMNGGNCLMFGAMRVNTTVTEMRYWG